MTNTTSSHRTRSYNQLSERLRQFMAEGRFSDGDKLPAERTLAETFGVSRSSIRDAIRNLAERGLLESRQGDGTYVRNPDMEPLAGAILQVVHEEGLLFDQVSEFRMALEPTIAALAATRRSPEQLDRLKIITCDQQRLLVLGEPDGNLDAQFHLCLAECAGNRLFIETVAQLNSMYARGRSPEVRDEAWRQFSLESHLRIIDALEHQSPEDCRKAVEDHLRTVMQKHIFATSRDAE